MSLRTYPPYLLLLTVVLVGCGHKGDPKMLMVQAAKLEQAGNLKGALIQLKNAAQASSTDKDVRLRLGELYLAVENYPAAEDEFKRARQNGADAATADPLIAQALLGQHEYQRLVEELSLPDKHAPSYAALLGMRARALIGLGRRGEAEKLLDEAAQDKLQSPELYLTRASLALVDHKFDEASQDLGEGLKLDPKHIDSLMLRAALLNATGKRTDAEATYRTILTIRPGHRGAELALAKIAIEGNRLDDARNQVESILKDAPRDLSAMYTLALIDFKQKKITEARDQLLPVLKAAPEYLPAVLLSGAVEFSLGNLESAQSDLLKVLKANPNHMYARRTLAAAQLRLGQADLAHATLAPLNPETSEDTATLIVAGEIAMAHRQFAQAESFFDKAARLDPQSAAIRTDLGLARVDQGEAQGLADLENAAASNQGSLRAATLLVVAHLRRGEFDAALKAAAEMQQKQPQSPLPAFLSGSAYVGKKDPITARKYFDQALAKNASYFPAAAALAQLDLNDGQIKAAQGRFDQVLAADPKNIEAMQAEALLALKSGQENKYIEWLNKATQSDSKAFQPRALIAQYYLNKRDFAKALEAALGASNAQPDNPAALELLGTAQLAAGETDNAVATDTRLAELKPDVAIFRFQLGKALLAAKQAPAAQASFEQAIRLDPHLIQAQVALAALHTQTGRYDQAIKIAREIQSSQPNNMIGLELEGDIHLAAKQPGEALSFYEKAANKQASGTLIIKQGYALDALGRSADGEGRMAIWLRRNPEDAAVRERYAESLLSRSQFPAAVEQYRYLSTKAPNNLMVLNNLAYVLAQIKNKDAVRVAGQALRLAPDNPATLDTMGWALAQTGQPAKAIVYLEKALSRTPDAGDIQYHYAAALAASGDKIHARQELNTLMARGNNFASEAQATQLFQQLNSSP
jgi:putative PEP-CTERM system TPR-repeat lipoprotein